MKPSGKNLYSAKQAAFMTGLGSVDLKIILDRDYVETTIVPKGDRTYRMFDHDQLFLLWAFARFTNWGIKPSNAACCVSNLKLLLHGDVRVQGLYCVAFDSRGLPKFVYREQVSENSPATEGVVFDYVNQLAAFDSQLQFLPHFDRILRDETGPDE